MEEKRPPEGPGGETALGVGARRTFRALRGGAWRALLSLSADAGRARSGSGAAPTSMGELCVRAGCARESKEGTGAAAAAGSAPAPVDCPATAASLEG